MLSLRPHGARAFGNGQLAAPACTLRFLTRAQCSWQRAACCPCMHTEPLRLAKSCLRRKAHERRAAPLCAQRICFAACLFVQVPGICFHHILWEHASSCKCQECVSITSFGSMPLRACARNVSITSFGSMPRCKCQEHVSITHLVSCLLVQVPGIRVHHILW